MNILPRPPDPYDREVAVTEFTIFDVCPNCTGLNPKPCLPEDCRWCGEGRKAVLRIIQAIHRRNRLKAAKASKPAPCKICLEIHHNLEVYHE